MLFIRKLLFLGFTIIYIIACPLLILYALGYIYSPVTGELVHTGVLHISTIPSGADIFLEQSRFTHRTPATINDLLAGKYNLTLKKKGYRPWTQQITIEGGKAVTLNNVLLIPLFWPLKNMAQSASEDLVNTGNERFFVTAGGSALSDYFICGPAKGIGRLLPLDSPFLPFSVVKIFDCVKSSAMVVEAGPFWDRKYLYINPRENEPCAIDITNLTHGGISPPIWQDSENTLFYRKDKCINLIEVKEMNSTPCFFEKIRGFGTFSQWLYVIDANGVLSRQSFDGTIKENLSTDIFTAQAFFNRSGFYTIDVRNKNTFFFLGTEGDFLVNLPPYYIAPESVEGYRFSPGENMLLFWTKHSLSVADFSVGGDNVLFHENFKIETVYQNSKEIKQGLWADENSHILCNDDSSIFLIELHPQVSAHVEHVVNVKKNTQVFYDAEEKSLFYLDKDTGVLTRIEIIPKSSITILPSEL